MTTMVRPVSPVKVRAAFIERLDIQIFSSTTLLRAFSEAVAVIGSILMDVKGPEKTPKTKLIKSNSNPISTSYTDA